MLGGLQVNSCAQSLCVLLSHVWTQAQARYLLAHGRRYSVHEQNAAAQRTLKSNNKGPAELAE